MPSIAKRIHPSLVQLSINTTIHNLLSHNKDLGDIEITLLDEILNECTADQLFQIEKASSKRRDLCSVTDGIWNQLYIRRFGARNARQETMMMRLERTDLFNWRQIFNMKLKEVAKADKKSKDKIKRQILKEVIVGKLKKSFKQIKKAYKKIAKNAVLGIPVFVVVLAAAVVTDLILGIIIVAMSPVLIPISLINESASLRKKFLIPIRAVRNVIRYGKCDSTF